MNEGYSMSHTAAASEPEIQRLLQRQTKALSELEQEAAALLTRVSCVCAPEPPRPADKLKAVNEANSEVGQTISNCIGRLCELTNSISNTLARLGV